MILYNFSVGRADMREGPGRRRALRLIWTGPLRHFAEKSDKTADKSGKCLKNRVNPGYFNRFVKILQFFDQITVEIFPALDYNKSRKSEEGPKC